MQYGSRLDKLSGISMNIYKAKCMKSYRNSIRLKCENYVAEVGFRRYLVIKIRVFLRPLLYTTGNFPVDTVFTIDK